jgi:hypothetical protein
MGVDPLSRYEMNSSRPAERVEESRSLQNIRR